MTVSIPEVLKKYSVGDGLTDEELNVLFKFFEDAEDALNKLARYYNAGYGLAHDSARHSVQLLDGFRRARLIQKREKS